ncbi:MAG TPA: response regulator [Bacteroidia bacterium]|nr:response regulator [Bacteroidia bacterium]HNU33837.1 response regulator [Bacteroidia bacterium]
MDGHKFSILHIEDDIVDTMVVERILRKKNLVSELYHAKNGVEALDLLRGKNGKNIRPEIILLDLNMPKMSGLEFLKELRADDDLKSIKVYVLTTSDDVNDKKSAYEYNVSGYIIKPINAMEFENVFDVLKDFWTLNQKNKEA